MIPRWGRLLIGAMLLAAPLGVMAFVVGPQRLLGQLAALDPWLVGLAATLYLALWIPKAGKWSLLLRADGIRLGLPALASTLLLANTANILLPAKLGDVARGLIVQKEAKVSFWRAMASSVIDRILDLIGILLLAAVLIFVIPGLPLAAEVVTSLRIAAVVGAAAATLMLASPGLLRWLGAKVLARMTATKHALEEAVHPIVAVRRRPLLLAGLLAGAAAIWALEGIVTYAIALAAGLDLPAALVVAAVQVANLTKAVPVTPGGIGVYEVTMAGLLVVGGAPGEAAFLVATVDHALKNAMTCLPAVPAASHLGLSLLRMPAREEPDGAGP